MPTPQLLDDRSARATRRGRRRAGNGYRLRIADVGQRRQVEGLQLSLRPETTTHAVAAFEWNERRRVLIAQAIQMRARLAAQMEEMLESSFATNAVRAPRRSSSAFVATVVPCAKRTTFSAPTARAAASTESSCRTAVGTFAVRTRPPSRSTASVNVPPTSTPRIATRVLCIAVALRALLFDFDGLILDMETPRAGWEWAYREHGQELPEEKASSPARQALEPMTTEARHELLSVRR
jgi:hypothetical protein